MIPRTCVVLVLGLAFVSRPAGAQTASTGAIAGTVKDATGAVLPGVTVEASSPALIEKVRTAVTDGQGNYKIIDLRPGTYSVAFTLPGFGSVTVESVPLTSGITATVNGDLKVGALEETVTVTGASPMIDIQNVRSQTVLSREQLDAVPTNKTLASFAALTLGASTTFQDVGGNTGDTFTSLTIHGGPANKLRVDGFSAHVNNANGDGSAGIYRINQVNVQEMALETGGISADTENGGMQVNAVPKDGGNTLSLYVSGSGTSSALDLGEIPDSLRARRLVTNPKVKKVWDLGVGLGGPIRKDTLWFYTAHRTWGAQTSTSGNYYNMTPHSVVYTPDLTRPAHLGDSSLRDHSLRLTWQAAAKHKIAVSNSSQWNCFCFFATLPGLVEPSATSHLRNFPSLTQMTWSNPATNRLLFEGGVTFALNRQKGAHAADASDTDVPIQDVGRGLFYNAKFTTALTVSDYGTTTSNQLGERFAMSYVTGSHAFKTGVELISGWHNVPIAVNEVPGLGPVSFTFRNGSPISVTQWASPHLVKVNLMPNLGVFAQDQWRIRRLTLNLGARFDYFRVYVPPTVRPAGRFAPEYRFDKLDNVPNWKNVSPRLGAAYDLFGNGKTAVKASLGRYAAAAGVGIGQLVAPSSAIATNATRTWADANGNFIPDCNLLVPGASGECGGLSNRAFGTPVPTTRWASDVLTSNRGYNWQGSASLQQELANGLGLNVAYFRTWYGNLTVTQNEAVAAGDFDSYCVTAPTDARLGPISGTPICGLYDVKPAQFGRVSSLITQASNFGTQTQVFNGVDIALNGRFGNGGLLSGGISLGRTTTDNCYQNALPNILAEGATAATPRIDAFCDITPPWSAGTQFKLNGVYPLPWGLRFSGTYQNLPGIQQLANAVFTNAQIAPVLGRNLAAGAAGTATVAVLPANTLFEDRLNQIDLRFTKGVKIGRARLQGMFDIYNVADTRTVLRLNTTYGANWLTPTSILGGRLLKFGGQFDF